MTSTKRYEEFLRIMFKGILHGSKPTPAEISKLAEIIGAVRGGKGRPRKEDARPRITDADFNNPQSMKRLYERLTGNKIHRLVADRFHKGPVVGTKRNIERKRQTVTAVQALTVNGKIKPIQACMAFIEDKRVMKTERDVYTGKRFIIRETNSGCDLLMSDQIFKAIVECLSISHEEAIKRFSK